MNDVKVKKLRPGARLPVRGSKDAAGADLCACLDYDLVSIPPHTTKMIPTGLAMEIPVGLFGAIYARSGLASKKGLRPANCVGVIDSDYRGEIMVALHNDTDLNQMIDNGERIAQLVLSPYAVNAFHEVSELSETVRGDGGFGSTGEKAVKKKKKNQDFSQEEGEWW